MSSFPWAREGASDAAAPATATPAPLTTVLREIGDMLSVVISKTPLENGTNPDRVLWFHPRLASICCCRHGVGFHAADLIRVPAIDADLVARALRACWRREARSRSVETASAARVDITSGDGKIRKLSQAAARGSDVNPMSDGDLEAKLPTAAAGWDPRYDARPLIDAIRALDKRADIADLASIAVPH